ncbi:ricin-type beta-trefoil lectin domain protein [Kitasatospora sp. NPDC058965]|uniref:ricin-type beta-trefoil lectin domain protein n=1 Tax=Kitasatospora sp. NPDC058965 TaxID=3346682 RepID=UPI0036774C04
MNTVNHTTAEAAGVDGLMVGLTRQDGSGATGKVSVSLDYGAVAQAYGGGWASRLHLVQLPACAQTTPQLAQCQTQTPLATTNDPVTHRLTAGVALPASGGSSAPRAMSMMAAPMAAAAASTTVAAVAGSSGSQGDYTATSLSASGSWSQSASGAFTYDYPIPVPPALGGTAPAVGLSYNSQSVDGETSARNSQSSWIGDGWGYSPGFIERSYKSCSNDGIAKSADECWAGSNATISLGSHNGQLVRDGSGVFHVQNDDGTKVELLTGASNGLWNGEYFKVTTTDGTAYYLGLNHSPGTTSDPATNSAWGVPVYTPKSGDPCYDSSKGNNSFCANMGYRFNLDFVVDPHGNVQRYDWATESNFYNMGYGQVAQSGAGGTMTQYTRGGYLTQISYGYQLADEQAGHDPAAKVVFSTAQRCVTDPTTCQASNLNSSTAPNWPDTPYDLNCTSSMATSGTGSNVCQVGAPTFWSSYRLQSIKTSVKNGSAWQDVDSWALTHLFSDAGGTMDPVTGKTVDPKDAGALQSVMWLSQIQHTGLDTSAGGTGTLALDPVTFTGVETDNRVDGLTPAAPPLYHPRISSLQTETGESIAVTYRAPECSRVNNTMPASPDSDTMACYNVNWTTPGGVTPISDWFQKTLVAQVSDNDATKAGSPAKVTTYTYSGGAAWHRDDSDLTDDQYRTWNDFRGYRTVTTTTGSAPDPITQTVTNYFQGMDGDYKADGSKRSVSLTNSLGESTPDSPWLAGSAQETDQDNQAGGSVVGRTLAEPETTTVTVTSPRTAWTAKTPAPATLSTLPDLTARRLQSSSSKTQALLANGSWRTDQSNATYDSLGRPQQVDNKGDIAAPGQEVCTTTSYANPPASNPMMLSYPSESVSVSGPCGTAAGSGSTVSDRRLFYDGDGSLGNPGTFGQLGANAYVTATQTVQSYDASGNPVFQTLNAQSYDQYGRVTKQLDAAGAATGTSYSPATATMPTSVSTTNPLGWTETRTVAAGRSLVTHVVDPNGRITDATYDPLGRRTAVWAPGRAMATQSADKQFSYAVHGAGANPDPSSVTTRTLREDGSYGVSVEILDGFLQSRQTQTTTADNSAGRLITSVHYDSHGWAHSSSGTFADTTTAPGATLFVETENTLPQETVDAYDGLGRQTTRTLYSKAAPLWSATTAYPGADETDFTPPAGGTAESVFSDGLGRKTSTVKHGGTGVGDITTGYRYDFAGRLATVKDTGGNTWSYSYDLTGHQTAQTDPDTGTTRTTYDQLGRTATTTDARGQVLGFTYDVLGRKTGEYAGANTGDQTKQLAGWSYDTLAKGLPTSSTRYVGGSGTGGSAYVQAVTGYDTAYQPTGTTVTLPAAEGGLAGTYTVTSKYTPTTGLLSDTVYGSEGGLPAEDLGYGYNLQGGLVSTGSDFAPYLDLASYSPLGQIQQSTYGVLGKQLRTAQTYDDATGRPSTNRVSLQTASTNPISATSYTFDQAGNLTASSELQSSGGADQAYDTQCFQYDGLRRLTQAWTDTAGTTAPTAGQLGHCATANPAPATLGGPAPYWTSWQYNSLGDRTQQVQHDLTGASANDTVQTPAYPSNGVQPNTATSVGTTGATGSSVLTAQYDPAGNTTRRTATAASALVSGLTPSGGRLCLDDYHSSTAEQNPVDIYTCNASSAQTWTVGTDGTVRVLGKCLDTAGGATGTGTKVVLATCTGTGTQVWGTNTNGSLSHKQSGLCLDDPSSSTTPGTQVQIYTCNGSNAQKWTPAGSGTAVLAGQSQTFTYDAEGLIQSVSTTTGTGSAQNTGYLYDADGALLIQRSPTGTVLYLFSGAEQLTLATGATKPTGTRYYSHPDGTVIVRTSAGKLSYQPANPQHTAQLQVDAGTLAITRRAYDPYGTPRGTVPGSWADNRGFLGQPTDSVTGLDLLGARHYDAALGRFLSADPVLEVNDPRQMGGYSYAADSPTNGSDPTGLDFWDDLGDYAMDAGAFVAGVAVGAALVACVGTVVVAPECVAAGALIFETGVCLAGGDPGPGAPEVPRDPAVRDDPPIPYSETPQELRDDMAPKNRGHVDPPTGTDTPVDDTPGGASAPAGDDSGSSSSGGGGGSNGGSGSGGSSGGPSGGGHSHGGHSRSRGSGSAGASGHGHVVEDEPGCSFSPETQVLMADGSAKAIADVKPGDLVQSADQATATDQGGHRVTATVVRADEDLVDLTVQNPDGSQSTVHTTANHPFWDETTHTFTPAGDLKAGEDLKSSTGQRVRVLGVRLIAGLKAMYNLTVDRLHTYYVLAGRTPVLVHNVCLTQGKMEDGDHLVLGVNGPNSGDKLTAALNAKDGGNRFTLNGKKPWGDMGVAKPKWMEAVEAAAGNPRIKISFALDGLLDENEKPYASAQETLNGTLPRGRAVASTNFQNMQKSGNQTAWELATVVRAVVMAQADLKYDGETTGRADWNSIEWYWQGEKVELDQPPWATEQR